MKLYMYTRLTCDVMQYNIFSQLCSYLYLYNRQLSNCARIIFKEIDWLHSANVQFKVKVSICLKLLFWFIYFCWPWLACSNSIRHCLLWVEPAESPPVPVTNDARATPEKSPIIVTLHVHEQAWRVRGFTRSNDNFFCVYNNILSFAYYSKTWVS